MFTVIKSELNRFNNKTEQKPAMHAHTMQLLMVNIYDSSFLTLQQ